MRAKFIYEKFTQESDPIQDMRIGSTFHKNNFQYINEIAKFIICRLPIILGTDDIPNDIAKSNTHLLNPIYIPILNEYIAKYVRIKNDHVNNSIRWNVYNEMKKILIKKGYIHHYISDDRDVNEKFAQDSDPIKDIGVGIRRSY